MKIRFYQTFILGVLAISALFLLIMPVKAAEKSGVQISPTTYNYEIKPGESKDGKIVLKNLNATPLNYVIEVENFSQVSDEGAPSFAVDKSKDCTPSIANWFFFSANEKGTIQPGESSEIPFTVSAPKDAEPGGHYAAIFGRQIVDLTDANNQMAVTSRVGTLILISVPGEVKTGAQITEFTAPKYVLSGPIDFSMKVKNIGSVHYDSTGSVSIKPMLGSTQKFNLATHTILPGNSRSYERKWTNKYPFGYYKVTPMATDGSKKDVAGTPIAIIAIPLVIVIPVLAGLIALIMLTVYLKKHLRFVDEQNKMPKQQ